MRSLSLLAGRTVHIDIGLKRVILKHLPCFRYAASPGFGTLFHYRSCRQKNYTECMTQFERVTDTRVADWAERLQEKVEHVREIVFGSKHVIP